MLNSRRPWRRFLELGNFGLFSYFKFLLHLTWFFPIFLPLPSVQSWQRRTRSERKVKGGGSRESWSKNCIPL